MKLTHTQVVQLLAAYPCEQLIVRTNCGSYLVPGKTREPTGAAAHIYGVEDLVYLRLSTPLQDVDLIRGPILNPFYLLVPPAHATSSFELLDDGRISIGGKGWPEYAVEFVEKVPSEKLWMALYERS